MTRPVDVMARAVERLRSPHPDHAQDAANNAAAIALHEYSAAVAELIEAGNDWCDLMPGLAGGPEFDRFVAALANAGGTK